MADKFVTDSDKLKDVLLYTFSKCPPDRLGAVKLHKVLYFSDMMLYAKRRIPLTGAIYRKRKLGPTCESLLRSLRELERDKEISVGTEDYFGFKKTVYNLSRPFDASNRLSIEEREVIDEVIEFVCNNNSAKTISEFSHNRAWDLASYEEVIPYHTVLQMLPQEVSLEAMEWASEEVSEVEAERSKADTVGYVSLDAFRGRIRAQSSRH